MSLELTIFNGEFPIISKEINILDVVKESSVTDYEFVYVKSDKTFNVTIKTNCPSYVYLHQIHSIPKYKFWTEEYLAEYSKKNLSEYYDTENILNDFIGSIRHGTYTNMFCIIDLYRKVKKTNIELSTTDLFSRLFLFLNKIDRTLWNFYVSDFIFYGLFQEKMVNIITFLYSKKAFKKADGILVALSNLPKSKNNYFFDSIEFILNVFTDRKKKNLYSFILFNKRCAQIPYRLIYSYI
jgi:hypothetical protein